jgi:hypothetical protein
MSNFWLSALCSLFIRALASVVMVKLPLHLLELTASPSSLAASPPLRPLSCSSHALYYNNSPCSSYCACLLLFGHLSFAFTFSAARRHHYPRLLLRAHRRHHRSIYAARTFASLSIPPVLPSTAIMSADPFSDCYACLEGGSPTYEEHDGKNDAKTIAFPDTIPVPFLKAVRPIRVPCSAFSDFSSSTDSNRSSPTLPSSYTKIEWTNANLGQNSPKRFQLTETNVQ